MKVFFWGLSNDYKDAIKKILPLTIKTKKF